MTDGRRAPHPANTLNELPGEEWLYFTKSLLTTAYPSELGHAARRVHGANKPPRLMARLIEEAGDADARRPTQQQRPGRPVRGVIQPLCEAGKCLFAAHEARARVADRHTAFYGPGDDRPGHVPTGGVG